MTERYPASRTWRASRYRAAPWVLYWSVSACRTASAKWSARSASLSMTTVWSAFAAAAASRAPSLSSNSRRSNPTVKAATGASVQVAATPRTDDESSPPLIRQPTGTPATMRSRIASSVSSRVRSTACEKVRESLPEDFPRFDAAGKSQYRSSRTPPFPARSTCPGGTCRTPANSDRRSSGHATSQ